MSKVKHPKEIKCKCISCENDTNHSVLRRYDETVADEYAPVESYDTYMVLKCKGCDHVYFRKESRFSEDLDYDQHGKPYIPAKIECFPEVLEDIHGLYLGSQLWHIPDIVQEIYSETISAIQRDLFTLAGVGVRAILEAVCQDRNITDKVLIAKINRMRKKSLITAEGKKILHSIRELGNKAAHQMQAPTKEQLVAAMKVIDHLLLGVYIIPKEASVLPKPKTTSKKVTKKKATRKKTSKAKEGS